MQLLKIKQFRLVWLRKLVNELKRIKDHALKGKWQGYREFHPARYGSDGKQYDGWIVVYHLDNDELILLLVTTGPHEVLTQ